MPGRRFSNNRRGLPLDTGRQAPTRHHAIRRCSFPLRDPETLFGTAYGRVLALKLVVFIVMLGLGALTFSPLVRRFFARLNRYTNELSLARKALSRIGAESFLALLVFFVTGLLTVLPPGIHAAHQAALANASAVTAAGGLTTPDLKPAEGARIEIISPKGRCLRATESRCGLN
jgi:Copper resistance protein D